MGILEKDIDKKKEQPRLCDAYRKKLAEHVRKDQRIAGIETKDIKRTKPQYAE